MLNKLWLDEGGALLSVELILLIVITVIGISVGMVVLRDAVVTAFQDVSAALNSMDPSFSLDGLVYESTSINSTGSSATVSGSAYDSVTTVGDYGNSVVAGIDSTDDPDTAKLVFIDSVP
jgi:hypothetical protein